MSAQIHENGVYAATTEAGTSISAIDSKTSNSTPRNTSSRFDFVLNPGKRLARTPVNLLKHWQHKSNVYEMKPANNHSHLARRAPKTYP